MPNPAKLPPAILFESPARLGDTKNAWLSFCGGSGVNLSANSLLAGESRGDAVPNGDKEARNGEVYYLITRKAGQDDSVARLPINSNETVLDAILQSPGNVTVSTRMARFMRPTRISGLFGETPTMSAANGCCTFLSATTRRTVLCYQATEYLLKILPLFASSTEFMGEFWLRKLAKCVI